jgi:hypothetical protein
MLAEGAEVLEDDQSTDSRAARELLSELRTLHVAAGEPSSRAVAEAIGGMSHTTVNQVLRFRKIPSWPVLSKIVNQLGGDQEMFRILWTATRDIDTADISNLPSPGAGNPEVSVFVSYAHVDDKATYNRVRQFVEDVGNTYASMTGREVGTFFDHHSIAPGENWKDRILLGLSSSSIFLAFISPAYIRSVNCNQEFWEFLHFLNANSTTRLVIPLLFANEARMREQFGSDELWREVTKLQWEDISELRSAALGSSEWLKQTQHIANRIENVLKDVASRPAPAEAIDTDTIGDSSEPEPSPAMLEKIDALEDSVPETMAQMQKLKDLLLSFGNHMKLASPMMNRATTTKKKISVSRQLARRIDPISDELMEVAESFRRNMRIWDDTVHALMSQSRRYPDWIAQSASAQEGINSIKELANVGIEAFSKLDELHEIFGQGRGLSAALDDPLRKTQDALLILADVRGLFVGWRDGLEAV